MQPVTFIAPTSWASALINGDPSGLSDEDCLAIDVCLDALVSKCGNAHVVDMKELGFRRPGDFGMLMGDYSEYTIVPTKKAS